LKNSIKIEFVGFYFQGRAQQLFKAGYKTLLDVASANPKEMASKIEHLPIKVANQLVSSAKVSTLLFPTYFY
jgi:hypothetical protein